MDKYKRLVGQGGVKKGKAASSIVGIETSPNVGQAPKGMNSLFFGNLFDNGCRRVFVGDATQLQVPRTKPRGHETLEILLDLAQHQDVLLTLTLIYAVKIYISQMGAQVLPKLH
eukprot:scaffold127893_cov62-Attheya_sp.AAC.1